MTDREYVTEVGPNPDGRKPKPGENRPPQSHRIRDEFKAGWSMADLSVRWAKTEAQIEETIRRFL